MREPSQIIVRPLLTEKSTDLQKLNKFCFEVAQDATKIDIRHAIEALGNCQGEKVKTPSVKGKKRLTSPVRRSGGRNNSGKLTMRHVGGGAKRLYRAIDFKRDKIGVPGKVVAIEYDPNRSARIALVQYADGDKRYILAPQALIVGTPVVSADDADIKAGNSLKMRNIPVGTTIHAIELYPGKGAQMVRSAGTGAQLMAKEGKYAQVRLPSGETRSVLLECRASIGSVGNSDHESAPLGKAGRKRHLATRPPGR